MTRIIECVPNFSEGVDRQVIDAIRASIAEVHGVKVLHVDAGAAANRTVITFAGAPEAVVEAAFRAVRTAGDRIDMHRQHGEHPRIGATDVLPLVPVDGVMLDECAIWARQLAQRVGGELAIPVYCYEAAAAAPYRRGLEACRRGEYEGLAAKMADPAWQPDYGPTAYNERVARTGASIIGARNFLGAVNFNLAPAADPEGDTAVAREIARQIRTNSHGPDSLPNLKAIGWYIDEYGFAQVSTNLTDMRATGLAKVYQAVSKAAGQKGMLVTGTEVIGLLPEWVLTDAGRELAGDPDMTAESALQVAIGQLGLDTMREQGRVFDPDRKIIERLLKA